MKRLLILSFVIGLCAVSIHAAHAEGLLGLVMQACVVGDVDTASAPGYTESAFRAVSEGDLPAEVERRLGKPLLVYPMVGESHCEQWWFTNKRATRSFHMRTITFCSGRVTEKNAEFYLG